MGEVLSNLSLDRAGQAPGVGQLLRQVATPRTEGRYRHHRLIGAVLLELHQRVGRTSLRQFLDGIAGAFEEVERVVQAVARRADPVTSDHRTLDVEHSPEEVVPRGDQAVVGQPARQVVHQVEQPAKVVGRSAFLDPSGEHTELSQNCLMCICG